MLGVFTVAMLVVAAVSLVRGLAFPSGSSPLALTILLLGLGGAVAILFGFKKFTLARLRLVEVAAFAMVAAYLAVQGYGSLTTAIAQGNGGLALSQWNWMVSLFVLLTITYGIAIPNSRPRAIAMVVALSLTPLIVGAAAWLRSPRTGELMAASRDPLGWVNALLMLLVGAALAIFSAYVVERYFKVAFEARLSTMYDLEEKVGSGGMGEVWRANHKTLARPAAVKLIREDMIVDGDNEAARLMLRRFEREAKATAALRSPHTVEIYDFGVAKDGTFFYAMEYLEGLDLETLVERFGPVSGERAVYLLRQACESLADAHQNGLTHRDIKPANIRACRLGVAYDFVKVLDFGLVMSTPLEDLSEQLTADGTTSGTPAYMAPEMALGKGDVDGRADIYALGCVGYWLLTGEQVFEGDTPVAVLVEHVKTAPVPPSQRCEIDIPADLEAVILRCLEKEPEDRYQTAEELAAALAACTTARAWDNQRAMEWWDLHMPRAAA